MNTQYPEILKDKLNINLSEKKQKIFDKYVEIFLSKNAHTNLISKNDEKFIFEKHIFDSLAINLFFEKYKKEFNYTGKRLLDIGTGGGFPLIPIAILYNSLKVCGLDSTGKKIKLVNEISTELGLNNVMTICDRAENLQKTKKNSFDIVTSRAVASMDLILKYSLPLMKKEGFFVAYKSKKALEELKNAKYILKTNHAKVVDIIEYQLPLEEVYERNLVVVSYSEK